MENITTKITSSYNNALDIKVVDGHLQPTTPISTNTLT